MIRSVRTISIVMLLAALSGCGAIELAYAIAPRIAVEFADEYFYLTKQQEADALALFEQRKLEHQQQELPQYIAYLDKIEALLDKPLDTEAVDALFVDGQEILQHGLVRTMPSIAEIMAGLDKDQVDYFGKQLDNTIAEYREKQQEKRSDEDRARHEFEDFEEWLGPLRDDQKELIRGFVAEMHDARPGWLQWRIDRNRMLLDLLRADAGKERLEQFLVNSWIQRDGIPEELERQSIHNRERLIAMIVSLDGTLDEKQREHLFHHIGELRKTVVSLMPDEMQARYAP